MTIAIVEISPSQALQMQMAGACLLDVREPDEHALGMACHAIAAPQQTLENAAADFCPSLPD